MKILREGRLPAPWSKEVSCVGGSTLLEPGCGSRLGVEEGDLFLVRSGDYVRIGFVCAFCRQVNHVSKDFYPGKISRLPSQKKWEASRPGRAAERPPRPRDPDWL